MTKNGKTARFSRADIAALVALVVLAVLVLLSIFLYPAIRAQAAMTFQPLPMYIFAVICYPLMGCAGGVILACAVRKIFTIELSQKMRKICIIAGAVIFVGAYIGVYFAVSLQSFIVLEAFSIVVGAMFPMGQTSSL